MIATVNNRVKDYFPEERARLGGRELPWAAPMGRVNPAEKVAVLAETAAPQVPPYLSRLQAGRSGGPLPDEKV